MKKVLFVLMSSLTFMGCATARLNTAPTPLTKLPCGVVFEDKDEETGRDFVGLVCAKDELVKFFSTWNGINAWQNDAWQKCGPKDGKAQK